MNFYDAKKLLKLYFETDVCKIENRNFKKHYQNVKTAIEEALNELSRDEYNVICDLYIKKKSRHIIGIERYISESTIYRIVHKFSMNLYIKVFKNDNLEISSFYVINYLQNKV